MKRTLLTLAAALAIGSTLSISHLPIAHAQNAPAGNAGPTDNNGGPPGGGPGADNNGPPGMGGPGGDQNGPGGGGGNHDGMQGDGGHHGNPNGSGNAMFGRNGGGGMPQDFIRFQGFLGIVEQYAKLSQNPEAAGVSAVVSAGDLLKKQGPQAAIDFFNKQLATAKMDAVKRAIHLQLIDLYRAANQPEKALAEATALMNAEPTTKPNAE